MQIRLLKMKWVALCVGMFLMAGPAAPIRADSWFTFKSSKGKSKAADESPGVKVPPPEDPDTDDPAPEPTPREPAVNKTLVTEVDCPPADTVYATEVASCKMRPYINGCCKRCCRDPYRCSCWKPLNPWYCDPRDLQVYSAQGHNVPVTVPLAPMVQTYNYGWGIPSSRISQAGGYTSWQPDRAFTQSGGRLPTNYPTVYHPTDTTQLGYYYNYVPTWQPRW